MKCDFSLKHYREILKLALKSGFVITNFRDFDKVSNRPKVIILRHDIDVLPKRSLELAKIEKSLKIKSTFFVRVHGQYYYPSGQTLKILKKIKDLGHEIGLHSEARVLAPVFKMDLADLFLSEKAILEEVLKCKIITASEHGDLGRPGNFWQNHFFKKIPKEKVGIKHYSQEYSQFHYLSDSLQNWKDGCVCQNLARYNHFQILIHGEWWGKGAKAEMTKLNKTYAKI
ncbi:MAG: hypothetical protein M1429_01465 [Patescibacteria group bacterium]|nr:hypothetical protein [Patescibacteria group bacterium]